MRELEKKKSYNELEAENRELRHENMMQSWDSFGRENAELRHNIVQLETRNRELEISLKSDGRFEKDIKLIQSLREEISLFKECANYMPGTEKHTKLWRKACDISVKRGEFVNGKI